MFWTPEMLNLAERNDRSADLVVADWLEERDCRVAAECFRAETFTLWRLILTELAKLAPDVAPRGPILSMIDAHVYHSIQMQKRLGEERQVTMQWGLDLTRFIAAGPDLPKLSDLPT